MDDNRTSRRDFLRQVGTYGAVGGAAIAGGTVAMVVDGELSRECHGGSMPYCAQDFVSRAIPYGGPAAIGAAILDNEVHKVRHDGQETGMGRRMAIAGASFAIIGGGNFGLRKTLG